MCLQTHSNIRALRAHPICATTRYIPSPGSLSSGKVPGEMVVLNQKPQLAVGKHCKGAEDHCSSRPCSGNDPMSPSVKLRVMRKVAFELHVLEGFVGGHQDCICAASPQTPGAHACSNKTYKPSSPVGDGETIDKTAGRACNTGNRHIFRQSNDVLSISSPLQSKILK